MPRGFSFAQITWLLIRSDNNFTGTSNPRKHQPPAVPCSGPLLPRYPYTQVFRDKVPQIQIHRAQLSAMADACLERSWDRGRSLPPWVRVGRAGPHPDLLSSRCDGYTLAPRVTTVPLTGLSSSASSSLGLLPKL